MTEPIPVRPEHGAALTEWDRDPTVHQVDELDLPEWDG